MWWLPSMLSARHRACLCDNAEVDHRLRVFEVVLDLVEADPNSWLADSVTGPSGRVVREIAIENLSS